MDINDLQRRFGGDGYTCYKTGVVSEALGIQTILSPDDLAFIEDNDTNSLVSIIRLYEQHNPICRITSDKSTDDQITFKLAAFESNNHQVEVIIGADGNTIVSIVGLPHQLSVDDKNLPLVLNSIKKAVTCGLNPISPDFIYDLKTLYKLPRNKTLSVDDRISAAICLARNHGVIPAKFSVDVERLDSRVNNVVMRITDFGTTNKADDELANPAFYYQIKNVMQQISLANMESSETGSLQPLVDYSEALSKVEGFSLCVLPSQVVGLIPDSRLTALPPTKMVRDLRDAANSEIVAVAYGEPKEVSARLYQDDLMRGHLARAISTLDEHYSATRVVDGKLRAVIGDDVGGNINVEMVFGENWCFNDDGGVVVQLDARLVSADSKESHLYATQIILDGAGNVNQASHPILLEAFIVANKNASIIRDLKNNNSSIRLDGEYRKQGLGIFSFNSFEDRDYITSNNSDIKITEVKYSEGCTAKKPITSFVVTHQ